MRVFAYRNILLEIYLGHISILARGSNEDEAFLRNFSFFRDRGSSHIHTFFLQFLDLIEDRKHPESRAVFWTDFFASWMWNTGFLVHSLHPTCVVCCRLWREFSHGCHSHNTFDLIFSVWWPLKVALMCSKWHTLTFDDTNQWLWWCFALLFSWHLNKTVWSKSWFPLEIRLTKWFSFGFD